METFGVRKLKKLKKLRKKWQDRKEEDGVFAEFLLSECRLKEEDPDVQQAKLLEKELSDLERLEKLQQCRERWHALPQEVKPERIFIEKQVELTAKWHALFVAEKEISPEELKMLSLEQLEDLREIDDMMRDQKWREVMGKKCRQLQQGPMPVPLVTGQTAQWASTQWSPTIWATLGQCGVDAALQFIADCPAVTSSEQPDEDCPICCLSFPHDTVTLPDKDCISLPCSHTHCFHRSCLHTWFSAGHFTCPVCRTDHRV
uniref:RING-type domain-containing protein n=1 Tax=viral metagenome TaxID=1070528 RepID=A0A6C0JYE2_9ZZZZ